MARRSESLEAKSRKVDRKIHQNFKAREAIQAAMIVKRIMEFVLDDGKDEEHTARVFMSSTKVNAASILLRKVMPDLATIEMNVKGDGIDKNAELEKARLFAEGPKLVENG